MEEKQIVDFLINHAKGNYRYFDFEKESIYRNVGNGLSYPGDYSYCIHKKEIQTKDETPYLPYNLMPSLPKLNTTTEQNHKQYIQKITKDISLIIQTNSGNISGVGFGKGWQILVGINYFGMMFKVYGYKTSNDEYEIEGILNEEFYKTIDFKNFELCKIPKKYLQDYGEITNYPAEDEVKEFSKLFELYVIGDVFHYYSSIRYFFNLHNDQDKKRITNIQKSFSNLKFKTLIIEEEIHYSYLKIPETCEEIIFNLKKETNKITNSYDCSFKAKIENSISILLDYSHLFVDQKAKNIADKIKIKNALMQKIQAIIMIDFIYKGISGKVISNQLAYEKMVDYYSLDNNEIIIDVLDAKVKIENTEFLKSISIKDVKNESKTIKALGGNKIGLTSWWLKEFEKYKL